MNTISSYITVALKQFISGLLQGLGFYVGFTLLLNHKKWLDIDWISNNILNIIDPLFNSNGLDAKHESNNEVKKSKNNTDTPEFDYNTIVTSSSRSTSIGNESDLGSLPIIGEGKAVEMLVHNVSHGDMVLSLGGSDIISENSSSSDSTNFVLCQPRFSAFDSFSRRILNCAFPGKPNVISFPRYERKDTPRYSLVTPRASRQAKLPMGFHFSKNDVVPLLHEELPWLRIRGRDSHRVKGLDARMKWYQRKKLENISPPQNDEAPEKNDKLFIDAVFFPLISTLLSKWEQQCNLVKGKNVKKVVILVSGVGTPRNYTHSLTGNSTRFCAHLMEKYINFLYPDVTVVRIHSEESNIFRYDENLNFVKRQLIPCIDAYRDAHARGLPYPDEITDSLNIRCSDNEFDPDWKKNFKVTLSFADGSPARTYAIQASLRPYRPTYFHVWQLKTFWHNTKICDDDIEIHSYDEMEITPAIDVSIANKRVQSMVEELKRFKHEFLTKMTQRNDLARFWLRKTKKPVLAVLLVESNGLSKIYRGTNMEVSMPTGSLCAERNVIGTALATDPSLRREDLKMVAVLAVPFVADSPGMSTKHSNMVVSQLSMKLAEDSNDDVSCANAGSLPSSPYIPMLPIKKSTSMSSFTSFVLEDDIKDDGDHPSRINQSHASSGTNSNATPLYSDLPAVPITNHELSSSSSGTVLRRINLYNTDTDFENQYCQVINNPESNKTIKTPRNNNYSKKKMKRTVVVHSCEDINPLRPCGACNEWLKKIAESNPYFKVLTFTDADCNGVYVASCQE